MTPPSDIARWREAHIGFENDGLEIGGLEIWKLPWRSANEQPVQLPHPAHPQQIHRFDIHEVGDVGQPVRFAACELSNGVWGFYVPMELPVVSVGAWLEGTQICRHESPDGTIRVDLASVEMSNTHWVNSPQVTEIASGRIVLDLWNTDWDATVWFPGDRRVRLDFRRYRHAGYLAAELDLARNTYRIFVGLGDREALPEEPLDDIASGLEVASRRAAEIDALAPRGHGASRAVPRHRAFAAWRTALLIVAGALVVIAAATLLAVRFGIGDKPKLDTVPVMPR